MKRSVHFNMNKEVVFQKCRLLRKIGMNLFFMVEKILNFDENGGKLNQKGKSNDYNLIN